MRDIKESSLENSHKDLFLVNKLVYEPLGLLISNVRKEAESKEYGAYEFNLNNKKVKFRVAKITPKKVGQFVTLWKREGLGPIIPYDVTDPIDLFIVSVRSGDLIGQFVFSTDTLYKNGILSKAGIGGKRAMRVYPSWDIATNKQAKSTQNWQLEYFFEISALNLDIDGVLIGRLFL